jgi:arylsulfatase A-like enzyme
MNGDGRRIRLNLAALGCAGLLLGSVAAGGGQRPNVVLVMTDDQGFGDLGVHGNPVIRTPNLDRFAKESVWLKNFYVSPVCAPTRASLLTGRYHYRTGVTDTYQGRAMMFNDEVTLAESLHEAGYRTGIFGKWHLGDTYPLRPQEQGFEEVLVHHGGGIAQQADPPANHYQDPYLLHNGTLQRFEGYCSDIYTTAAMEFIQAHRAEPFFVYLAFNCPHTPLEVPAGYDHYTADQVRDANYPREGAAFDAAANAQPAAKIYAMVENIDHNLGRLFGKLNELGLAENTIVIFITDNGPQQARFNAGLRGLKGTVYDGGIRVASYWRWPARWRPRIVELPTAHLDVTPTLLAACGAKKSERPIDGRNLRELLDDPTIAWPDRTIVGQNHRGDLPERRRSCMVRGTRWKLVQPLGSYHTELPPDAPWELYDMPVDPYEQHNVAAQHPEIVQELAAVYDQWYDAMQAERGFAKPRIVLGTEHENPILLTRQDWREAESHQGIGHWDVLVPDTATYDLSVRFAALPSDGQLRLRFGPVERTQRLSAGAREYEFLEVELPAGEGQIEAWTEADGKRVGVQFLEAKRRTR